MAIIIRRNLFWFAVILGLKGTKQVTIAIIPLYEAKRKRSRMANVYNLEIIYKVRQ